MSHRTLAMPLLLLALALGTGPVAAHGDGQPWIWLESERVPTDEPFNVLVLDFAPYGVVGLEVVTGQRREAIGTITCAGDGHGEGQLRLPADFPNGYAEMFARDGQGGEAVTLVHVGEVPEGALPPTRPDNQPTALWQDPSVLTLGGLLAAAVLGLAYALLKRRPPPPEREAVPRRAVSAKRRLRARRP